MYFSNNNQNKTGVAIFVSDKADLKQRIWTGIESFNNDKRVNSAELHKNS